MLYGASDEAIVKQFDITAESVTRSIPSAHSDYIRCLRSFPNEEQHILTGGYDHYIRIFDFRAASNDPVREFSTNAPVESLEILPSGLTFVSAQDTTMTLWDVRMESRISEINVNQKTVTTLGQIQINNDVRIISGSLDQQIKIIRPDIFEVSHQFKWQQPIMSIATTQNQLNIVIGGSEGKIEIKARNNKQEMEEEDEDNEKEQDYLPQFLKDNPYLQKRIKNYRFYNRGIYQNPKSFDLKIDNKDKPSLGVYDRLVLKFEYKEAILKAFREKQSAVILSLCEEFASRGVFEIGLGRLNDEEFNLIAEWVEKKICNPKYQECALMILNHLSSKTQIIQNQVEYPEQIGKSEDLRKALLDEANIEKQMIEIKGLLVTLMHPQD